MITKLLGVFVILTIGLGASESVDKKVTDHVQFIIRPGGIAVPVLPVQLMVVQSAGEPFKSGEVANCTIFARSYGVQSVGGEEKDLTEIVAKCKGGKDFVMKGVQFSTGR